MQFDVDLYKYNLIQCRTGSLESIRKISCFVRPLARGLPSTMSRQPAQQGRDEESVKSIIESVTKTLLTKEDM